MPVYPERLQSRQEARASCDSQFWEQEVQTPKSLGGHCQTLPCEPPPLALCASSGLNQAQQMLAFQALGPPLIPAYDAAHGGIVLDRVVLKAGGKAWWGTLLARARAEQMWRTHRQGKKAGDVLKDLNNYSMAIRGRTALSKRCAGNVVVEVPNMQQAREAVEEGGAAALQRSGDDAVCKGQASLKFQLPGHEVRAKAVRNMQYLDSAAAYSTVPLAVSLDLCSVVRGDGIQYRAGFHQVSAPGEEAAHGGRLGPSQGPQTEDCSLHFQGAVAVSGEATLWKASHDRNVWPQARRTATDPFDDEFQSGSNMGSYSDEEYLDNGDGAPQQATNDVYSSPSTSREGAAHPGEGRSEVEESWLRPLDWRQGPARQGERLGLRGGGQKSSQQAQQNGGAGSRPAPESSEAGAATNTPKQLRFGSTPARLSAESSSGRDVWSPWDPAPRSPRAQMREWRDMMGEGPLLEGVRPAEIRSGLLGARASLEGLRAGIRQVDKQVRERNQVPQTGAVPRGKAQRGARRPYSLLLAEPFIKVNGAIGCLTRVPLPHQAFRLGQYPLSEDNASSEASTQDGGGGSRWSKELWTPYLRDTALRVFASCGLSAQAGHFARRFGDYTAGSLRFDLGMTSADAPYTPTASNGSKEKTPRSSPQRGPHGRLLRHRAFALEGRGIWHAASVSLTQQVWGPLRARLDARVALDTTAQVTPEGQRRSTFKGLATGAPWIQPVVLETVWGADLIIPGSQGAARACVWYSPTRREGMLGLRLG